MKQIFILSLVVLAFAGCRKEEGVNLFTVSQDIEFGEQMAAEIAKDTVEYPLLSETKYPRVYAKLDSIRDVLLASGLFEYKDRFSWDVKVINKDVLNAFATPGGHIYFYTGLLKFMDNEAELAGILGHEMAHADLRHSTKQLTKAYGFSLMLSIVLGNDSASLAGIAKNLASGLASLKFSRDDEYMADEYSVKYLCKTSYDPKGITVFFQKMIDAQNSGTTITFLSTHPADADRIANVEKVWKENGSVIGNKYESQYAAFKTKLP
jgi:predicted Zn-dependent protease